MPAGIRLAVIGASVAVAWAAVCLVVGVVSPSSATSDVNDLGVGQTTEISEARSPVVAPIAPAVPVAPLERIVSPVSPVLDPVAAVAAPITAPLATTVAPVTAAVSAVAAPVAVPAVAAVTPVVAPVTAAVASTVAPVTAAAVEPVIAPIVEPVMAIVTPAAGAVVAVVTPVTSVLVSATAPMADLVAPATDAVVDIVVTPAPVDSTVKLPGLAAMSVPGQSGSFTGSSTVASFSPSAFADAVRDSATTAGLLGVPTASVVMDAPEPPLEPLGAPAGTDPNSTLLPSTAPGSAASGASAGHTSFAEAPTGPQAARLASAVLRTFGAEALPSAPTFDLGSTPD